jgi:hypothetical protein
MADSEIPYVRHPADFSTPVRYGHGPDSYRQPTVPRGTVLDDVWTASRVFPRTNRRYWVYVPAQYTASEPASLMVFQDGHMYLDPEGQMRAFYRHGQPDPRSEMPVASSGASPKSGAATGTPELIHDTPKKPLRVFLQAATRDLNWDAAELNWFSANLRVAAALAEREYDLRLVLGDGGHDLNHGGAILPDALRWLWRRESE